MRNLVDYQSDKAIKVHQSSLGEPCNDCGDRFNKGKDRWELLPTDAVRSIVKILTHGAIKYGPRNWSKGLSWSETYASLLRHLTAWYEGEDKDLESGYSHLWHAGCNIIFLITFELRKLGTDDRDIIKNDRPPTTSNIQ